MNTLPLEAVADLNEVLAVDYENERRMMKVEERKAKAQNR